MPDNTATLQAELLDRYWENVRRDAAAPAPEGLSPALAGVAAALAAGGLAPAQDEASTARVRSRLNAAMAAAHAAAAPAPRAWRWPQLLQAPRPRGLALAAVLAVALLGAYLLALRPAAVSAQAVVQRAQAAAASPLAGGVNTFVLTSVDRTWDPAGRLPNTRSEEQRWYAGPERWRVESRQDALAADGTATRRAESIAVSDGTDAWQYDVLANRVTVQRASPALGGQGSVSGFGQGLTDLGGLLAEASRCFQPRLAGSGSVAGRDAYVVDLGATTCPSAALPEFNGRQVIWVDKETSFILKWDLYAAGGRQLIAENEVTAVQYNVAIDPARFTFTLPAGAGLRDLRPAALATPTAVAPPDAATPTAPAAAAVPPAAGARPDAAASLTAALAPLAPAVDYPLFAPAQVTDGLAPRQPRLDPADPGRSAVLRLEFVPPDRLTAEADAAAQGVQVLEQRATYEILAGWTEGATAIAVKTGRAWVRRGESRADGTGSASTVLALRGGTLIAATSFALEPEALLALVAGLQPVAGSHPDLAEPLPPTLAEVRGQSTLPVFVPAWLPAGLRAEPPVGSRIVYHDAAGRRVLTVITAAAGSGPADPRATGQDVRLANGATAHLLGGGGGDTLLWWEQGGANISLQGTGLAPETLQRIAGSLSASADLAGVELPPALAATPAPGMPTPTPLPTPAFTLLKPGWLPEPMTERVQVDGDGVLLGYAPTAGGAARSAVLTLRETPLQPGAPVEGVRDAEATSETIGGRQVTVVHRSGACTMYEWTAGSLRLTLANIYDPPGQVKYSCEQMRRVVESMR